MNLVQKILGQLAATDGPVAIHAGHFPLEIEPRTGLVYPAVREELVARDLDPALTNWARAHTGVFPMATFELALDLADELRRSDRSVKILTTVNDLTASLRRSSKGAGVERQEFFHAYPNATLAAYEQALRARDWNSEELLIGLGTRHPLVLESWLRNRRFKSRLKRGTKAQEQLSVDNDGRVLLEGLACPIMSQGQATCAGELCELHLQLKERGFRSFVNFYPVACRGFVEASLDIADELWGLENYQSIEVGLPSGAQTRDDLFQGLHFRVGC